MNYVKIKTGGSRHTLKNFLGGVDMRFDEGLVSEGTATVIKNLKFESGALTDGYGLEEDSLYKGISVWSVWDFTRYDFAAGKYITVKMLCDSAGKVRYYSGGVWNVLTGAAFTSPPRAAVYRLYGDDTVIMTSNTDNMAIWNGTGNAETIACSPFITSMALHYERMFATTAGEQNAVYFSDDLDPTNWNQTLTEGGYIQLLDERGKLLKVIDYLNYVYIFREYGVSRLTAYGDQQEFSAVNLYVAGGRIHSGSVVQTGANVMLLSGEGLYSFDGYDMSRKLKNLKFEESVEASAVYLNGKYYLAARLSGFAPGNSPAANNALIVYDLTSGAYAVSEMGIARLMVSGGAVYASTYGSRLGRVTDSGFYFEEYMNKEWESGYSDFGTPERKTLKEISLLTKKPLFVFVYIDGTEYSYGVNASDLPVRIKPSLAGYRFKFKLIVYNPGANKRLSYVVQ